MAPSDDLGIFLALQDGFECNVASRMIVCISLSLSPLQQSLSSPEDNKPGLDRLSLARPILQALNILQGVALLHPASKNFLGRKTHVQLLLDILNLSRHLARATSTMVPTTPISQGNITIPDIPMRSASASSTSSSSSAVVEASPALAATVLDTLLCTLVDSPPALRAFEDANGVEAVVKTLKRAGVAKDIRMKCLEFLYFYLLPEDGSSPILTAPSTPTTPPRCLTPPPGAIHRSPTPHPHSVVPSLSYSASTVSSTDSRPITPPPPIKNHKALKPLVILKAEVDFVPTTPKKKAFLPRLGTPSKISNRAERPPSLRLASGDSDPATPGRRSMFPPSTPSRKKTFGDDPDQTMSREVSLRLKHGGSRKEVRTTDEKKEALSVWLGNVDALVEGVQKAGVWGLG
ncbi:hypothetical protein BOTBODRAFT_48303 [Botryobasidium botryosum FD-172 SS1]|uniref:CDC14-domain-containing protein n=1 Tax=Botryobasidium botryosum (strain FD-172 SS1) TaxID=930990 RepID=A0A067M9G3_BOTB1|nr:hypothetical protein BOTBODRAFT_48303 [Botryobasidium botryosum FD-172 SS1]